MFYRLSAAIEIFLIFIVSSAALRFSNPPLTDEMERIRAYTRQIEFDYINWTLNAAFLKIQAASVNLPFSMDPTAQKKVVADYLQTTQLILGKETLLTQIYADSSIFEKESTSAPLRTELADLHNRQNDLTPLAEAVIQDQISQVLAELGLTSLGEPVPNVLYHASPLPRALIVSRRDHIEQIANISVETDLPVDEQARLEEAVDQGLDVSSLVVSIGGIGVYPTMVMNTTDLNWLVETVSHEWTHNFLTLRPLGILYEASPELRTMNETAASIAGVEIGKLVLDKYYSELSPLSNSYLELAAFPGYRPASGPTPPSEFDFRAEMHTTRVHSDALLANGRIAEAEAYMEARRLVFLDHGYLLRKLNQAYFAFYGAYADVPGGAAGEDPVGPAVRSLRAQSTSLKDFLERMSWMTSFEQLQESIE